jgi:N-acetylglucosaminyldiphosphoundecaprenol N-acetyl-beta-D-mannosaminyltransferase
LKPGLEAKAPGLKIAGMHAPPFRPLTDDEDREITERINASGARVVFVGIGMPKQERWMHAHRGRINAVMLGVGAAFDFHAGTVRQAPAWMQKRGLEWLYRLFAEPRRLWRRYSRDVPLFGMLSLLEIARGKPRDTSTVDRTLL